MGVPHRRPDARAALRPQGQARPGGPRRRRHRRPRARLLAANGVTAETATLINSELPDYVEKLGKGEADAGFLVLAAEARTIQRLLRRAERRLMSFANADAYIQRFPFLTRLVLREGVVDFAANLPPADTVLLATTAAVLVREDAHRALVSLLAQAVQEVHGAAGSSTRAARPSCSSAPASSRWRATPSFRSPRRRAASIARVRPSCSATCRSGSPP